MENPRAISEERAYLLNSQHFTKNLPPNLQPKSALFQPPREKNDDNKIKTSNHN
jgi:hypothetical protein